MPTPCMHTRLHGPQGCTSVSYTTSWFGSPEVNKLVVRAGLRTLTTGKYLIGPGSTQHQGCDQPALWSTRTKRRSERERRLTIVWPQNIPAVPLYSASSLSQVQQGLDSGDTQGDLMFPLRCSPTVPLYLLLRSFCSLARPPTLRVSAHCSYCNSRKSTSMWPTLLVKGFNPFGPWAPRVGVYNEVDETRGHSPLYSFLRSFGVYLLWSFAAFLKCVLTTVNGMWSSWDKYVFISYFLDVTSYTSMRLIKKCSSPARFD